MLMFHLRAEGLEKSPGIVNIATLVKSICFFLIRFRSHNQSRTNFPPWEIFEKLSRQHRDLASLSSCKFKFASLHFCTLASSNPLNFLLHEKLGKCTWVRDRFTFFLPPLQDQLWKYKSWFCRFQERFGQIAHLSSPRLDLFLNKEVKNWNRWLIRQIWQISQNSITVPSHESE